MVVGEVSGTGRRVDGFESNPGLFEERFRRDRLSRVSCEIVIHQLEESLVAHFATQRIQKQHSLSLLAAEVIQRRVRDEFQAADDGALGIEGFLYIARLEHPPVLG